ncbi:RsmB/NOP family class I SAM-dependent RNA methyltransferase [Ammonicoccus fulvus]|uniref:RsmB/NOP family class I SAM-dependent RNA methyltransferase n=1 Tax=Ammonicoccus fulvus TaxID=3138240 RepID=A0ABZ3FRT5_9ACTN
MTPADGRPGRDNNRTNPGNPGKRGGPSAGSARRGSRPRGRNRRRPVDPARRAAFDALRAVTAHDAYANLAGPALFTERQLSTRDAAFATELLNGTARLMGTYDRIIEAAGGRKLSTLQAAIIDILRLSAHQLLSMRVPSHAAVAASVDLAGAAVGEHATGLVYAITRRIDAHDLAGWIENLSEGLDATDALALRTHHPRWIVDAYAEVLPAAEVEAALQANNEPPITTLAVRPGLTTVADLIDEGATAHPDLPTAATIAGSPRRLAAVREGRAGVQDPGSQRVALRLADTGAPEGPWLDLCAGPGGKAALLAGLAIEQGQRLYAAELQPHRAVLVAQALRAYAGPHAPVVVAADGTRPAWRPNHFARVMADVPCTGLGALRRRPEARWRKSEQALDSLVDLQRRLLTTAIESTTPGGVVAYVTCSPHRRETSEVVNTVLADRPDAERLGPDTQLWPHRDGTDAMFQALLRRR